MDWSRVNYFVDYCDVFISCLDSHSDGTHSLQSIHWWTGVVWIIVMFLSAVWALILTAPIHCRASIDELESCGLLWCFYQLFGLSFWRHPFTAEHPLMNWSRVDYCDVFISCLDSHSDGTHSLQSIHWWTGVVWIIVMFLSAVWTLILTAPIHCRASISEQVMQW